MTEEDEAFEELALKQGHWQHISGWRKKQIQQELSMKVAGPLHVVCQCDKCKAQPEQEPVAYATKEDFRRELEHRLKHIREEMKIKSVTMRCKDYDIALPIIDTDFGRVLVGQVSTPPQRLKAEEQCVLRQAIWDTAEVVTPPQRTEEKMVMWPCLIDTADFSKGTVTVVMQCEDYKVSAGTHWLSTTPPKETT